MQRFGRGGSRIGYGFGQHGGSQQSLPGVFNQAARSATNRLGTAKWSGISASGFLTTAQRILGTINQVRPMMHQISPFYYHAKRIYQYARNFQNKRKKNTTFGQEATLNPEMTQSPQTASSSQVHFAEVMANAPHVEAPIDVQVKKIQRDNLRAQRVQPPYYPSDF